MSAGPKKKSRLHRYWPLLVVCLLILVVASTIDFDHPRIASIIDFNHPRIRGFKPDDPREPLPDIANKVRVDEALKHQGELSETHLTVRWSVGCKTDLPPYVEVKIPREYLMRNAIFVNTGCVESIKVGFIVPSGAPWADNARLEKSAVDPATLEARARGWPREVHLIIKAGNRKFSHWVDGMRDRASNPESYRRTGNFDGLERRQRFTCFSDSEATNHLGTHAYLAAKPPDDTSPTNCRFVPGEATLTTPSTAMDNDEVVGMWCHDTGCSAYFATGLLSLEVMIWPHQLERWREVLEEARKLARTFIVYESLSAYEVGVKSVNQFLK